ncbi:MAG TPA: hypothetical protein VEO56_09790 [Bacteroidota bacterium]|nr:hypothetical protein [Bacteroidota bacterium]
MSRYQGLKGLLIICAAALVSGCGSTPELTSTWTNSKTQADSSGAKWSAPLSEIKDTRVFLGLQNDQDFIYVHIVTPTEQFRRQMMGPGLTVSFESEDGKKIGILYPMGGFSRGGYTQGQAQAPPEGDQVDRTEQLASQDLEILGPGKDDRALFSPLQVPGIRVKVALSQGSAFYDLRIPLKETPDFPYAIGTASGAKVRLTLETGKAQSVRSGGGEGSEGGRGSGGGGGGGGFGGGGYGGGRRGGRGGGGGYSRGGSSGESRPDPIDYKADVLLSVSGTK